MLKLIYLAKNILNSNFRESKIPYRLTYILTYRCQLKCQMCNIWQKPCGGELSLEQIKTFFKKSNKFSWINLSGGEIFLRNDLIDIINVIAINCKRLYLLDFPTNGLNTSNILYVIKNIMKLKIPKILVTVSVDGPGDLHDKIRGVPDAWINAVETFAQLRKLRNSRFGVFLGMTLQPANLGRFQETIDSVNRKIGCISYNDFHINILQRSSHYYSNLTTVGSGINKDRIREEMREITKLRKSLLFNPIGYLERKYQKLSKMYLENNITPLPCQAFSASFFMDPSGDIYPCSIYNRSIGNIAEFNYNISRVWDSDNKKQVRQLIKNNACPGCWTPCEAYQSILANIFRS